MSQDASQPNSGGIRPEWNLPEIQDIRIRRIPFEPPKLRNFKSVLAEYKEAVEILVSTNGPIPARALGPALFIGDVQIIESQQVETNLYRFLAFDIEQLKPGAAIRWGWIDDHEEQRQRTKFRYEENVSNQKFV
jgi:hypothetical protein